MNPNQKFNLLRNIIYFSLSVLLFFSGVIVYGIILNVRENTLEEEMRNKGIEKLANVNIIIEKSRYRLGLYSDNKLVKEYKAVFGKNSGKVKSSGKDNITPFGKYKICKIDTTRLYYKLLGLNYPNEEDAATALKNKIISRDEFLDIVENLRTSGCSSKNTVLSAEIGIHGIGENNFIFKNLPFAFNWTNGSIAVSNESIDEIISVVKIGTNVEIKN